MNASALSRSGQVNSTGGSFANDTNLFLKKFAGEILTTFETATVMKAITTVRTIENGKSAQFPVTGIATAAYHVAGADLMGTLGQIGHAERVINVDELLVATTFIADIDQARNHYDVRSIYTTELGRALAKQFDKNLLQLTILAAQAAAVVTGGKTGATITTTNGAGVAPTGDQICAALYSAAQQLDQNDVPSEDRHVILDPTTYYAIVSGASRAINVDWNGNSGANGTYADGKVMRVAGIQIHDSNNLPSGVVAAVTGQNNTYSGTFTSTIGVVLHKAAVGTVKLMDLAVESQYMIQNQGTLLVAKYAMGHGILRPECAVWLKRVP